MPLPISKVNERDRKCEAQFDPAELMNLLPLIQLNPVMILQDRQENKKERDAVKEMWLNSSDVDGHRVKVTAGVSNKTLSFLKSKAYIKGNDDLYEFTDSGRRVLKESILNDEESEFCKQASRQLVSNKSYDFGEEVLIKVNHPEKFGAKYISMSKAIFDKRKMKAKDMDDHAIETRKEDGELKELKDYSDEDLIAVLSLTKKVIKNASKISFATGRAVQVNRIKAFADMIMTEINSDREEAA